MLLYINMNLVPVALPAQITGMKTETGGEDAPLGNHEIKLTLSLMLAHVVAVWTQCKSNQPGLFGTKILNYADTQLYVSVSLRCAYFVQQYKRWRSGRRQIFSPQV